MPRALKKALNCASHVTFTHPNNNKYKGDITQLCENKSETKLVRNTRVTSQTQQLKHMLIRVFTTFVVNFCDWSR